MIDSFPYSIRYDNPLSNIVPSLGDFFPYSTQYDTTIVADSFPYSIQYDNPGIPAEDELLATLSDYLDRREVERVKMGSELGGAGRA